eukprot:4450955-Pyramimonas_sp.AAC.1
MRDEVSQPSHQVLRAAHTQEQVHRLSVAETRCQSIRSRRAPWRGEKNFCSRVRRKTCSGVVEAA